jgi:signal transduction histidine kinase
MLYYFTALMTAALVLLLSNPRSEVNRWAALFLGFAAIGGIVDKLAQLNYIRLANAAEYFNLTITPYAVLIFSLVYSAIPANKRYKATLKVVLLLPVIAMLIITPFDPKLQIDYLLLLLWAGPYYLAACCVLLVSLQRESHPSKRRNRRVTTIIMVPTLLAALLFIYVIRVIFPDFDFFEYVSYFLVYSFAVALLCLFVYGVLGVRLRIERDPLDNAMKAVTTGAKLLNHTIKNEIGKIAISSENLRRTMAPEDETSLQQLQVISASSEHMLAMVERIHSRMRDIVLKPQPYRLDQLVEQLMGQFKPRFDEAKVTGIATFLVRPTLLSDPVHAKEAIANLLANAVEAMVDGGTITVTIQENNRSIKLVIEDSGPGISEESLSRVLEPFYTTKASRDNFGLGLSYVYNVMRKSGGSIDVASKAGAGTKVTLLFPSNSRISDKEVRSNG